MAAEGGLKLRDLRHHEVQLGGLVGELALQIEKIRARNMPGLKGVPPGHGDIGNAGARGLVFEIGGAVEQPQIWLTQQAGKFRRTDQRVRFRHVSLPFV